MGFLPFLFAWFRGVWQREDADRLAASSPWNDYISVNVEFLRGRVVWEHERKVVLIRHLNAACRRQRKKPKLSGKFTIANDTVYVMEGLELCVTYPTMGISDIVVSTRDPKVFGYMAMNPKTGTPFLFICRVKNKGLKGDYVEAALAAARLREISTPTIEDESPSLDQIPSMSSQHTTVTASPQAELEGSQTDHSEIESISSERVSVTSSLPGTPTAFASEFEAELKDPPPTVQTEEDPERVSTTLSMTGTKDPPPTVQTEEDPERVSTTLSMTGTKDPPPTVQTEEDPERVSSMLSMTGAAATCPDNELEFLSLMSITTPPPPPPPPPLCQDGEETCTPQHCTVVRLGQSVVTVSAQELQRVRDALHSRPNPIPVPQRKPEDDCTNMMRALEHALGVLRDHVALSSSESDLETWVSQDEWDD